MTFTSTPTRATTMTALPAGCAPPRAGHFGAWRALAAFPTVAGSVLVMLVLTAALSRWQTPVFLLWLGAAGLLSLDPPDRFLSHAEPACC
jgi:hypothetical protein